MLSSYSISHFGKQKLFRNASAGGIILHETVYDTTCNIINKLNDLLWGFGTIALVFGTGIYFTLRFKGFNVIHIVHIFSSEYSPRDL